MKLVRLLDFLVARSSLLGRLMLALMALLVLADVLIPRSDGHFAWSSFGGFGAVFGLIACALIIVVSRTLGHALLERPEHYYGDDGDVMDARIAARDGKVCADD